MAKVPSKPTTTTRKPAAKTSAAGATTTKKRVAKKPAAASTTTKKPATRPASTKKPGALAKANTKMASVPATPKPAPATVAKATAAKTPKVAKAGKKGGGKSLLQDASSKISNLASDILADRIVPTIEQIKTLAESLLGGEHGKNRKAKKKKK